MSTAFMIVILALIWASVTGNFQGLNLLFGGLIGGVVVLLLRQVLVGHNSIRRWRRILSLALLFLWELIVSTLQVARLVIQPNVRSQLQPAIVAVPLRVKSDWEITVLANLITLTPGTLSIDVSDDRSILHVHVLTAKDHEAVIRGIVNGFETKVMEVFE
jgi:multicomponent Na+:H+ antiporter subunit E